MMVTQTRIVPLITVRKNEFSQLSPRKIGDKEIRKKLKFREESALVLSHI